MNDRVTALRSWNRETDGGFDLGPSGVLIAIPAYNEQRAIGSVVLQARLNGWPVLVVDDGSHDDTSAIAAAAGAVVRRHEVNQGKAEALNTIFQMARECQAEVLLLVDGDGQHLVDEADLLLEPILNGRADMVIGSRFLNSSAGDVPKIRRMGLSMITKATQIASGTDISDSQSGYRAFSHRAIQELTFSSSGFSAEVEMLFTARNKGLRLAEVPITAVYNEGPVKRNVFGQGAGVLNGLLQLVGQHRPLMFFSGLGLLMLLLGSIGALVVVDIYRQTRTLAIGYSLITVLMCIMGLTSLFTGITLHSIRGGLVALETRMTKLVAVSQRPKGDFDL